MPEWAAAVEKIMVVCAILLALKNRGIDVAPFKSGPDYLNPMFHGESIGTEDTNPDLCFTQEELVRRLFLKHAAKWKV